VNGRKRSVSIRSCRLSAVAGDEVIEVGAGELALLSVKRWLVRRS
jgi:hypothetical protein